MKRSDIVVSGGKFDYMDRTLKEEIFGYLDKPINVFEDKEVSELVWDVLNLIHDYDWYASGDTCEETYLKAKSEFKKKWFGVPPESRMKRIIDGSMEDLRRELYKTYGVRSDDEDS